MERELQLVDTPEKMEAVLPHLRKAPEVALDVEADSLYHYFEKICLIQLATRSHIFVVDPLAGLPLPALLDVLKRKLLIIHGADYDLRLLFREFGFKPARLFETATAARLIAEPNIGLAALVERFFSVKLPKDARKQDWSSRPLREEMVAYAGNDVRYLPALKDALESRLQALGRLAWLAESCEQIVAAALLEKAMPDPDREWRFKGTSALRGQALALARALWYWREEEAKKSDRPPFKVVGNHTLLELAQLGAVSSVREALKKVRLPRTFNGRRLSALTAALAEAKRLPPSKWPSDRCRGEVLPFRPINRELYGRLIEVRDLAAAGLGLDPTLLCNRAAVEEIAMCRPETPESLREAGRLMKWQSALLETGFFAVLRDGRSASG